jgi:hypothetical protein
MEIANINSNRKQGTTISWGFFATAEASLPYFENIFKHQESLNLSLSSVTIDFWR